MKTIEIKPNWLRIMRSEAVRMSRRQSHPLLRADDLESVGNEAVCEVLKEYDPDADPVRFEATLRLCVRRRMLDEIRKVKGTRCEAGRTVEMPTDDAGQLVPFEDRLAERPDERAAVREMAASLPSPAEVRVKAALLRNAVLTAFTPQDVTDIMQAQARLAKAGDTRAARLCLQVIGVNVASVDQSDL